MTLLNELTELYWSLGEYSIDDRRRMKAVVFEISQRVRTWAPDEGQARICYLAINEVADRLIRECEEAGQSEGSAPVNEAEEIVDYYQALANQNPGKCVYHPPSEDAE